MFYSLVIVCERWDPGRVEVVEVAVEDIEAEVAHVRLHDGRRFGGGRVARGHSLDGQFIFSSRPLRRIDSKKESQD